MLPQAMIPVVVVLASRRSGTYPHKTAPYHPSDKNGPTSICIML